VSRRGDPGRVYCSDCDAAWLRSEADTSGFFEKCPACGQPTVPWRDPAKRKAYAYGPDPKGVTGVTLGCGLRPQLAFEGRVFFTPGLDFRFYPEYFPNGRGTWPCIPGTTERLPIEEEVSPPAAPWQRIRSWLRWVFLGTPGDDPRLNAEARAELVKIDGGPHGIRR